MSEEIIQEVQSGVSSTSPIQLPDELDTDAQLSDVMHQRYVDDTYAALFGNEAIPGIPVQQNSHGPDQSPVISPPVGQQATSPDQSAASLDMAKPVPDGGNPELDGETLSSGYSLFDIFKAARATGRDVGKGALESPRAVIGGIIDATQGAVDFISLLGGDAIRNASRGTALNILSKSIVYDKGTIRIIDTEPGEEPPKLPKISDPNSVTGKLIRGITEFAAACLPVARGVKLVGTGVNMARVSAGKSAWKAAGLGSKMAIGATEGALTDIIITSQSDQTLSTLLKEVPALQNPVTDFLATDDQSSVLEVKLKAALEGLALGATTDLFVGALRKYKQARTAPSVTDVALQKANRILEENISTVIQSTKKKIANADAETVINIDKHIQTLESLPAQIQEMHQSGIPRGTTLNEIEESLSSSIKGLKQHLGELDGITDLERTLTDTEDVQKTFSMALEKSAAYFNTLESHLGNPTAPTYTTTGGLNIASIKTTDDIKAVLQTSHDYLENAVKDAPDVNWEEAFGKLTTACGNKKIGEGWTKQEMLNAQSVLNILSERTIQVATAAQTTRSAADKAAFAHLLTLQTAVQQQVTTGRSVAGQVLRATQDVWQSTTEGIRVAQELCKNFSHTELVQLAKAAEDSPDALLNAAGKNTTLAAQAINVAAEKGKQAADALTGDSTISIDKLIDTFASLKEPEKASYFLAHGSDFTNMQKFVYWRTAALLTSPVTHSVNISSNILNSIIQIPERFIASHMKPSTGTDIAQKGEWAALAVGQLHGFMDAMRLFGSWDKIKKIGRAGSHEATQLPTSRILNRDTLPSLGVAADYLGRVVDIPMRMLGVADEFFKTIASRAELHALAYRRAKTMGMTDPKEIATYTAHLIENPPQHIMEQASDYAKYITFQSELDGVGKSFHELVDRTPWMRLIAPFTKTPTNVFGSALERTPLAPLFINYKKNIAQGGAASQLARARYALGTGTLMATGALSAAGYVTGRPPTDSGTRELWKAEGIQPYSIKVGETWYSYKAFEPLGTVLGISADMSNAVTQIDDPKQADDYARDFALILGDILDNKTFLSGVADFFEVVHNPSRLPGFIRDIGISAVPPGRIGAWANRIWDNTLRDTSEWVDKVYAQIPGFSTLSPPKLDIWGNPITVRPGVGPDCLSPMAYSDMKGDKLTRLLIERDVRIEMPKRSILFGDHGPTGIPLTSDEYYDYCRISGQETRKMLEPYTDKLVDLPPEQLKIEVGSIVRYTREWAREVLLEKYPRLRDTVEERRTAYAKALTETPEETPRSGKISAQEFSRNFN